MKSSKQKALYACTKTPKEQDVITTSWVSKQCKVSVCILAYNHEKYIAEALNSVLNQVTNFPFEILIHDDASKDKTASIIRKYQNQYPDIIKPIYQEKNQHSQNINPSVHFNYPRCSGEYIAFLEGDDFWCDPNKLQIQVNALDKNKDINLCFHQAYRISYFNTRRDITTIGNYAENNATIDFENTLFLTHGMMPTASCMIRQQTKEKIRIFMKDRPHLTLGDRFMQFFGSYPKGSLYINKPMSAYRFGTKGSWTASITKNLEHKVRHEKAMLLAYSDLNKEVNNELNKKIPMMYLQRLLWLLIPQPKEKNISHSSFLDTPFLPYQKNHDQGVKLILKKLLAVQQKTLNTLKTWNQDNDNKIIYGVGSGCKLILETIGSLNIQAAIDRDDKLTGKSINGVPIISLNNLKHYNNPKILVSTLIHNEEELGKIIRAGVPSKNIYYLFDSAAKWLSQNLFTEDELTSIYKSIKTTRKSY